MAQHIVSLALLVTLIDFDIFFELYDMSVPFKVCLDNYTKEF